MIEITAEVVGAEQVKASLDNASAAIRARVVGRVQRLGLELLAKVKAEKLTGQVLNVRTGRLRRSINEQTTDQGDHVESAVGTAVSYGRFWELGFRGVESVKTHMRLGHPVRAHSRHVNQAPRSFLQSSLDEMRSHILEQLSAAATEPI